jgi:3-phosphoshikimate 1-carboxyvinyltransferase
VDTYGDHRIAMAFAPLSLRTGKIRISDPEVVGKSYPGFWEEMKRVGFRIS